jgi:hypothetical protein
MRTDFIEFAQDGVGVGDTFFTLTVRTIRGHLVERVIRVHVTGNWQELAMEME